MSMLGDLAVASYIKELQESIKQNRHSPDRVSDKALVDYLEIKLADDLAGCESGYGR